MTTDSSTPGAPWADWLQGSLNGSASGRYRHNCLVEDESHRDRITGPLISFCQDALQDAKRRLRAVAGTSLDPVLGEEPDPVEGWPEHCEVLTLKGYFGETFAALIIKHFAPFGDHNWQVPAQLFRFHIAAFQQLEATRQTRRPARRLPGRTGDDCLAFQRDDSGTITRTLVCEAKCTAQHSAAMVSQAHSKASDPLPKPVDLPQLIEILLHSPDPTAAGWVTSLRKLWLGRLPDGYERVDMVVYVCGRRPRRGLAWIPQQTPHRRYTGARRLEAVEVHLSHIDELVRTVYRVGHGDDD